MQDNFLFDGTIKENIAFSKPGATDDEIRAAAHVAHCDEFVERFEKGYDTIVGERGVKLSGGQRQRVAIARAVLADPRILILDEATSSLDSESEAMIRDGLRSLRRGRTTFVIAHRLSTIESADQILVLEQGEIVERGTHRELIELGGRYRQLYEKQYGAEKDTFINPGEDFHSRRRRNGSERSDRDLAVSRPRRGMAYDCATRAMRTLLLLVARSRARRERRRARSTPARRRPRARRPFRVGERLTYQAKINFLNAGTATMSVVGIETDSRTTAYHTCSR